jgi:hypothetical protein
LIEAKRPHKPGRRAGLRACVSRPSAGAKVSHRRGDEIYPGVLRGLCSTLKDDLLSFIKT